MKQPKPKTPEQDKRKKMMQLQMIQQQLVALQQQLQLVDQNQTKLESAIQAIEDIQKAKIGSEMFTPVSSGIFVKASLKENTQFLIAVGSNVAVEKSSEETVSLLKKQNEEITKLRDEMVHNLESLADKGMMLETELNK